MLKFERAYPLILLISVCCETTNKAIDCQISGPDLSLTASAAGCNTSDGIITIDASGGNASLTYELNETGQITTQSQFTGLTSGDYTVTARNEEGCETTAQIELTSGVSLSSDIMPIIDSSCTISSCHQLLGPALETKEEIIHSAAAIKASVASGNMPPPTEPALSQDQISLILCWVNDGAPDN